VRGLGFAAPRHRDALVLSCPREYRADFEKPDVRPLAMLVVRDGSKQP
jgi:hypothetical protein